MKLLDKIAPKKNPFLLGIIISLMGSLPLGYINVISLQILIEQGNWATVSFILGIVFIEFFVLKIISVGAKRLVEQKKLLLFIDVFTIIFLLSISLYFFINIGNNTNFSLSQLNLTTYPFILGLLLNSLNFIQWPYWSGIYIFLFRTERLNPQGNGRNVFIIGAMLGTLFGMLAFAHTGKYFLVENIRMDKYLNIVFATLFFVLGIGQLLKLFFKHKIFNYKKLILNKK